MLDRCLSFSCATCTERHPEVPADPRRRSVRGLCFISFVLKNILGFFGILIVKVRALWSDRKLRKAAKAAGPKSETGTLLRGHFHFLVSSQQKICSKPIQFRKWIHGHCYPVAKKIKNKKQRSHAVLCLLSNVYFTQIQIQTAYNSRRLQPFTKKFKHVQKKIKQEGSWPGLECSD